MDSLKTLKVFYGDRQVGTLALYKGNVVAFEYAKDWLMDGFSISPFSLPLERKVFIPKIDPFDGLFGIFADSLPDGWGRLLVDRLMRKNGFDPVQLGNLDRLAIVGTSGMGALSYQPEFELGQDRSAPALDEIANECKKILSDQTVESLDFLFKNGGSSGGARPKIFANIDGEEWIIKFPSSQDIDDIGRQEYEYALCAKECGIIVEEVRLFESKLCDGYFGTRRFDRNEGERVHMVSVSALLETSHRIPNLDYDLLMRLCLMLTKSMEECEKLYRLMCFNVFAHNRDDHSKNFSFLYREKESRWVLSPSYDLTYSSSIGGEHATSIHGNGADPSMDDILAVAKEIGINRAISKRIANEVRDCVREKLKEWI